MKKASSKKTPFLLPLNMDTQFWEARYQEKQTGWDLGTVSPPLKAYFDQLISKDLAILIPGCGFGHEIKYLVSEGFTNVTALDLVEEPLTLLKETCPQVTCIQEDLFTFEGKFDLIIEQTIFCAIDPSGRERYMKKMASLLKPGGKYVGVLFDRTFESGPPFGGSSAEYRTYFEHYFSSFTLEPCYNSAAPRANTEVFFIAKK